MKFSQKRPGVFKTSEDKIQHPQAWKPCKRVSSIYWYQITINFQAISIKSH